MKAPNGGHAFGNHVERQARRLEKRRRPGPDPLWQGLANSGVIGWAVALPTLAGIFAGIYADQHFPGRFSFTLMGLSLGLIIGCLHASFWMSRQHRAIGNGDERHAEH